MLIGESMPEYGEELDVIIDGVLLGKFIRAAFTASSSCCKSCSMGRDHGGVNGAGEELATDGVESMGRRQEQKPIFQIDGRSAYLSKYLFGNVRSMFHTTPSFPRPPQRWPTFVQSIICILLAQVESCSRSCVI